MEIVQLVFGGLSNGCVYGLIALGFVLIYKATESISFVQGDLMMMGAFLALGLSNAEYLGWSFWVAAPLAILLMGGFSASLHKVVVLRLFGEGQIAVVILTIALGFIMRFIVGTVWGYEPRVLHTPLKSSEVVIGGAAVSASDLVIIAATAVLTGIFYLFFRFTKLGLAMQASSQNSLAAYYMGIRVRTVQSLTWGAAGMTAAVAGILYASKGSIDPSIGFLGIKAFAAAVIGGMGSLPGALIGGLLIGGIEPLAGRYIAAGYSQIAPYFLMFLVLLLRPDGLLAQTMAKKV